jgi:hypothetical protein
VKKRPLATTSHRGYKRSKNAKAVVSSTVSSECHNEELPVRKLIVFPSFDRSDSLIYLPYTLARKLNCGDHDSLRKTLHSYLHRDCSIYMGKPGGHVWNLDLMLQLFEITNDLHPDSVMCVHTCQVVENSITATMYFKFTDSVQLSEALGASSRDPFFQSIVKRNRGKVLKQRLALESRPVEEQQLLCSLADSNDDLVIYGKVDLVMTFDVYSKKVTTLVFDAQLTSLARYTAVPEIA